MKQEGIKLILVEPYFDLKTPNKIAADVGGHVVVLMPSVGGNKEITTYFQLVRLRYQPVGERLLQEQIMDVILTFYLHPSWPA